MLRELEMSGFGYKIENAFAICIVRQWRPELGSERFGISKW